MFQESQNASFQPKSAGGRILQQEKPALLHLVHAPPDYFSEHLSCLGPSHEQDNFAPHVVHIVLEQAPVSAVNSLEEKQWFINVYETFNFMLVAGSVEVIPSLIVYRLHGFEAELTSPSADVCLTSKGFENVYPRPSLDLPPGEINVTIANLGLKDVDTKGFADMSL